jgi:hypothetical protein
VNDALCHVMAHRRFNEASDRALRCTVSLCTRQEAEYRNVSGVVAKRAPQYGRGLTNVAAFKSANVVQGFLARLTK